jgi:hypothetical protein
MGCGAKLGVADELQVGRAEIDEDEVAGGKRVAVPLVGVHAPHPEPHERSRMFARRWLALHEVEEVVRHLRLDVLVEPEDVVGIPRALERHEPLVLRIAVDRARDITSDLDDVVDVASD